MFLKRRRKNQRQGPAPGAPAGRHLAAPGPVGGRGAGRGTREYTIALGEGRAWAAKSYLRGRGVQPTRMLTIPSGSAPPVDPGQAERAGAQTRRAVTVVNVTQ